MVTMVGIVLSCIIILASLVLLFWDEYAPVIKVWVAAQLDDWFGDINGSWMEDEE